MLRTRPNRMKPGFHLALARWKSRFTGFTAGQTRPPRESHAMRETSPACGLASLNLWADPGYGRIRAVKAKREDVASSRTYTSAIFRPPSGGPRRGGSCIGRQLRDHCLAPPLGRQTPDRGGGRTAETRALEGPPPEVQARPRASQRQLLLVSRRGQPRLEPKED